MPALSVRSAALGLLLAVAVYPFPTKAEPDAATVGRLLVEAIAALRDTVSVDLAGATNNDETVILADLTLTLPDAMVANLPVVTLSGILPREDGGFSAARVDLDGGSIASAERTIRWTAASLVDVVVPPAHIVKDRPKILPFSAMSMTKASIAGPAMAAPIEVATLNIEVGEIVEGASFRARLHATGVRLPTAPLAGSIAGPILDQLNYREFLAEIVLEAVYESETDTATVGMFTVDVPAVGRIILSGTASEVSINALTDPDDEVAATARSEARLNSVRLRFENAGFVEQLLDLQAGMLGMQGATRDDVRIQIVDGFLPFALSNYVKDKEFRTEFRDAVGIFLSDPRSLTLTAEPAEPVPLGQAARAALRAPQTLPDLLTPAVEANN
jgi:hypothetical protein